MGFISVITLAVSSLSITRAIANPRQLPRQNGCNDACYSALVTYNSGSPYSANGICWKWMSSYPPAHTTQTIRATEYDATVSPTTFTTRIETIWQLAGSNAQAAFVPSSGPAAVTPPPMAHPKRDFEMQRRQTSAASVAGLPLPSPNIVTSCNNDPAAFASACSCIGDVAQTSNVYSTTNIPSTTTVPMITRECTSTVTSQACLASATFGMQTQPLQFGDTGISSSANNTNWSNSTTAAACCSACHTSDQNCRFFTYTPPEGSSGSMADGGSCWLNLEGNTCPNNILPPNTFPYDYNYITEGIYIGSNTDGTGYGFGPCAVEVPYFYGYNDGRAGVGVCSASGATTTVIAS